MWKWKKLEVLSTYILISHNRRIVYNTSHSYEIYLVSGSCRPQHCRFQSFRQWKQCPKQFLATKTRHQPQLYIWHWQSKVLVVVATEPEYQPSNAQYPNTFDQCSVLVENRLYLQYWLHFFYIFELHVTVCQEVNWYEQKWHFELHHQQNSTFQKCTCIQFKCLSSNMCDMSGVYTVYTKAYLKCHWSLCALRLKVKQLWLDM